MIAVCSAPQLTGTPIANLIRQLKSEKSSEQWWEDEMESKSNKRQEEGRGAGKSERTRGDERMEEGGER